LASSNVIRYRVHQYLTCFAAIDLSGDTLGDLDFSFSFTTAFFVTVFVVTVIEK
jgi:hypothetical protein